MSTFQLNKRSSTLVSVLQLRQKFNQNKTKRRKRLKQKEENNHFDQTDRSVCKKEQPVLGPNQTVNYQTMNK